MKELTVELVKRKFKAGEVYRYIDMCAMLEQERAKGSKGKQLQLSNWERFMKLHKVSSTKFKVIEIRESELPYVDGRVNNGAEKKYEQYISLILANYLFKQEPSGESGNIYMAAMPMMDWFLTLGMVNSKYASRVGREYLIDGLEYEKTNVDYFFQDSREVFERIFKSSLRSLQARGVLEYSTPYIVKTNTVEVVDGLPIEEERIATDEETTMILKAKALAKIEYQKIFYKSRPHIEEKPFDKEIDIRIRGGSLGHYYKIVDRLLMEMSDGEIKGSYKVYKINYSLESIQYTLPSLEAKADVQALRDKEDKNTKIILNQNSTSAYIKRVDTNTKNYKANEPKLAFGKESCRLHRDKKRPYQSDYPEVQRQLAVEMLNICSSLEADALKEFMAIVNNNS